jgi:hypothetical protein
MLGTMLEGTGGKAGKLAPIRLVLLICLKVKRDKVGQLKWLNLKLHLFNLPMNKRVSRLTHKKIVFYFYFNTCVIVLWIFDNEIGSLTWFRFSSNGRTYISSLAYMNIVYYI